MDIKQFCTGHPERVRALADACDVTTATVYYWISGHCNPPPWRWQTIMRASGGAITIESLLGSYVGMAGETQDSQP